MEKKYLSTNKQVISMACFQFPLVMIFKACKRCLSCRIGRTILWQYFKTSHYLLQGGGGEGREGVVGGRRILRGNMVFHGKRSGISRCQRSRRALLKINCQLTANEGGQKNITEPCGVLGKFNRDTTKNLWQPFPPLPVTNYDRSLTFQYPYSKLIKHQISLSFLPLCRLLGWWVRPS